MNTTSWNNGIWGAMLIGLGGSLGCGARSTLDDLDPMGRVPAECWAADDELLILSHQELSVLNVRTRRVRSLGGVPCADEPFNSMAVSQRGTLYVGLESGRLIELDPGLNCRALPAIWEKGLSPTYGMSFLGTADSELLVLADGSDANTIRLITVDMQTDLVAHKSNVDLIDFSGPLELAGSPSRELYGFSVGDYRYPQLLLQLDVKSGTVLDRLELGPGIGIASFAVARLGHEIYTFTAREGDSGATILRTDLVTRRTGQHAKLPFSVIGAGVPGCIASGDR